MPALHVRAQRVCFSFANHVLLNDVTFHLTRGWTGLVGANGTGKTTLLRLLLGELTPTTGQLRIEPDGARVAWCAQRVEAMAPLIGDFSSANDRLARQLCGRLGLRPNTLARWPTLSPGERKRWQLGAVLWTQPEVLLLDEPGNHLDVEGLGLLREALEGFGGVGVLVSHDRALLDDVTHATLRLDAGTARQWPHAFSSARALWLGDEAARRDSQRETQRKLQQQERRLDASRRTLASSERSRSAGARMKSRHDSDARAMGQDLRAQNAERAHTAAAQRVERKVEAVREALGQIDVRDPAGQALFLRYEPCPHQTVVQFTGLVLGSEVALQLRRDEHTWVSGPNGSGKTTLLRLALDGCKVPDERRLLLPQELTLAESKADLSTLRELAEEQRGRVLQLVHALGVEPEQLLHTDEPSPGEARKLRLALGLGRNCWLAVLDEPTNHLDLPAIERLEVALREFPGALLLVTHDERLGAAVTTRRIAL